MAKKVRRRKVKRKPAPAPKPHREPDSPVKVEQKLGELRAYYEEGRESLSKHPDRMPYRTATRAQGVTASQGDRLRKARLFAERYTQEDLLWIETLCREHQMALGRSLIDRLATIHDQEGGRELEAEAIAGRWSKILVDCEIRKRFGRYRDSEGRLQDRGRKSRPPETPEEALAEIFRLCLKLTRWGGVVGWNQATGRIATELTIENKLRKNPIYDLPGEIIDQLKQALRATVKLQDAVEERLPERQS